MSRIASIDLNADLGEGCGSDEALLDLVSSANIACGWHAGGANAMHDCVRWAVKKGVSIGAHPSFNDLTVAQMEDQVVRGEATFAPLMREAGRKVEYVEAFEVSEYGAPLDEAARARLFPFLPTRPSERM